MIIACLNGGLGNQMFHYAAGCVLAEKHKTRLLLDTRLFNKYVSHNGFELDRIFNIDSNIAKKHEIKKLIGWRASAIGQKLIYKIKDTNYLSFLQRTHYYQEKYIPFNEDFFSINDNCYLFGNFQSERYFENYKELIQKKFDFKIPLSKQNSFIADKIKITPNSVSVHVRRGDYVNNANAIAIYYTCTPEYYERAMKQIANEMEEPTYFIFSDDIEWVKNNLSFPKNSYFIEHNNGLESYNDMRLTSLCDHHIIANSSFSWWGAWLNLKKNKIVIAPRLWFANGDDCSTIVPDGWLRL